MPSCKELETKLRDEMCITITSGYETLSKIAFLLSKVLIYVYYEYFLCNHAITIFSCILCGLVQSTFFDCVFKIIDTFH